MKKVMFFGIALIGASFAGLAFFGAWQTYVIAPSHTAGTDDRPTKMGTADASTAEHIKLLPLFRAALINPMARSTASISGTARPEGFFGGGFFGQPLNVLIAGIAGKGNSAPNLTDTVMVIHMDAVAEKAYLFSLPRDLLVQDTDSSYEMRLNGLYQRGGVTSLRLKAQDITGLEIDRYLIVDLQAVREIVDALGGINVYVEKDIYDPRFPGNGSSYETFSLKAGWRFMDGATAARYIRTRNDPEGDFGRMRRQQLLLDALKGKVSGLSMLWDMPTFLKIFGSIETHILTNLRTDELLQLFDWGRTLSAESIVIAPLDADKDKELFTTGEFWFGPERASIVKPVLGIENYARVKEYVQEVLNQ